VDSGQVGVFEERDKISLSSFLKSHHSRRLETKVSLQQQQQKRVRSSSHIQSNNKKNHLEILSDFTNKSLERELANEELSRLLVPSNFTKSDSSRAEPVRLLNTTSGSLKKENENMSHLM
jgi:uncharacterized protein YjiK